VPYDRSHPSYADLYHSYKNMPEDFAMKAASMGRVAPDWWKLQYFIRSRNTGYLVAHHYNSSAKRHGDRVEAVYNGKNRQDCAEGTGTLNLERSILDKIWLDPRQTDTCIGNCRGVDSWTRSSHAVAAGQARL
jgi:alpha-L-fucosidase